MHGDHFGAQFDQAGNDRNRTRQPVPVQLNRHGLMKPERAPPAAQHEFNVTQRRGGRFAFFADKVPLLVMDQRGVERIQPFDFEERLNVFVPSSPFRIIAAALRQRIFGAGRRPTPGCVGIQPQDQIGSVRGALFKGQIGFVADRNGRAGDRFALMVPHRFSQFIPAADFDCREACVTAQPHHFAAAFDQRGAQQRLGLGQFTRLEQAAQAFFPGQFPGGSSKCGLQAVHPGRSICGGALRATGLEPTVRENGQRPVNPAFIRVRSAAFAPDQAGRPETVG